MKRFDFHTHAYPEMIADRLTERMAPYSPAGKRYGNGTLQALTARNARQEIAACVQLNIAASPGSVPRMNEFAIKANAISGIYAFGALHPAYEKMEEELCRLRDAGIKGIKLHPAAQRFRMDAESVFPLYEAMAKHDMDSIVPLRSRSAGWRHRLCSANGSGSGNGAVSSVETGVGTFRRNG